jgi:hypothetical protein
MPTVIALPVDANLLAKPSSAFEVELTLDEVASACAPTFSIVAEALSTADITTSIADPPMPAIVYVLFNSFLLFSKVARSLSSDHINCACAIASIGSSKSCRSDRRNFSL